MKRWEMLDQLPAGAVGHWVYGDPQQTADGATVITAAKVRASGADGSGITAAPAGALVVRGDGAQWVPAIKVDRIALLGALTGLLSAVIACLAVLRRPPWPDLRITVDRHEGG